MPSDRNSIADFVAFLDAGRKEYMRMINCLRPPSSALALGADIVDEKKTCHGYFGASHGSHQPTHSII